MLANFSELRLSKAVLDLGYVAMYIVTFFFLVA